jgi:UDP-glucose:glycoprotein glucosyltransferase
MTKEAKLTAAMRILPEWKGYDEEIRELQKKIDSGLLDADPADPINIPGEKYWERIKVSWRLIFIFTETTDTHTEL